MRFSWLLPPSASQVVGITCGLWSNGDFGSFGLVVVIDSATSTAPELSPYNGFFTERCSIALPVACCAPVATE